MPYFILALLAAIVIWTVQQCSLDNSLWGQRDDRGQLRRDERTMAVLPGGARGDVRRVFSDGDYPADAQRNGEEGTAQARLDIDSSGRVTGCTIIRSSGHASLDTATCKILRERARFEPARDSAGNGRPDSYVTPPVAWRLAG